MKLALGTVQFGLTYGVANQRGQVPLADARDILQVAKASGMDTLDTAIGYGDSETRLGTIGVQEWRVVSKLGSVPEECDDIPRWATTAVRASLQRLGVSRLYGLLLHRPGQLLEPDGWRLFRALEQLREDGLVGKIGVSVYDPQQLDALCGAFRFDLVQAPLNILDRRLITSGWLSRLAALGTELHVRSVFLQGLLLMPADQRPSKFERWASLWAAYDAWLSETGLTPLQACLRDALSFPEVSKIIVGVDSPDHLMEILRSVEGGASPVPGALAAADPVLVNPSRWETLT
jgi:aryl-alcohol dehydrogenase-like predicted oxidoreductase